MKTSLIAVMVAVMVAAALAAGCTKASPSAPPATSEAALTAATFGHAVAPFGPLAAISKQSRRADVVTVLAGVPTRWDGPSVWFRLPGAHDVRCEIVVDPDTDRVDHLAFHLPARAEALLKSAWGAGTPGMIDGDRATSWNDPATGWRATLVVSPGDERKLELR